MILKILFDIIGAFLDPIFSIIKIIVVPLMLIALAGFFIRLLFEYSSLKSYEKKNGYDSRYKEPSHPNGYRISEDMFRCSNCDYSTRSYKEGEYWYCQRHQIDVHSNYVCDNYHTVIFDP